MTKPSLPNAAGDPTDIENTPDILRNPTPVDAAPSPEGKLAVPADAADLPAANAASNGYWLHDGAGPRTYIGPEDRSLLGVDAPRLIAAIEEQMGAVAGLDTSRVHLSVRNGKIVLSGRIDGTEARRRAGACAVAVAGAVPVLNRIVVTEQ